MPDIQRFSYNQGTTFQTVSTPRRAMPICTKCGLKICNSGCSNVCRCVKPGR